jgi:hypothetical protein
MPATTVPAVGLFPSSALLSFVRRQVYRDESYNGAERRTEPRHMMVMPVVVQAVDEQIAPVGQPQAMVIRNFSNNGAELVYEFPFEHKRIVIELTYPEEGKFLAAEIRWNKTLGPFYHLGCQVVAKLDRFPCN